MLLHASTAVACAEPKVGCDPLPSDPQALEPKLDSPAPPLTRQPADDALSAGTKRKSVKTIDINQDGSIAEPQQPAADPR